MTEPTSGLARFQSIKQVSAGEIKTLIYGRSDVDGAVGDPIAAYVQEADGTSVLRHFPPNFTARYVPKEGDFWVVYDGDGYQSVSPREAFLAGYVPIGPADDLRTARGGFDAAVLWLKAGKRVARDGWNGKGMFVFLVPGSTFIVNRPPLLGIYPEGTEVRYHAHIDMKTADGQVVPWLASQTDVLADDWGVVE